MKKKHYKIVVSDCISHSHAFDRSDALEPSGTLGRSASSSGAAETIKEE